MSTIKNDIQITPQDVFVASTTQGTDLGAQATTGDGRYFRYALVGATATVAGQLYQGPASDVVNFSPVGGIAIGQANVTGTNSFTLSTSLTLTANQLANGYMAGVVTPGIGQTYQVKSNSAVTSATGSVVTLLDPLRTNLSTASRVVFYPNMYSGIVVVGTAPTAPIVGVATTVIAAASYGWIQTKGPVGVLIGGTPGSGVAVGINLANTTGSVSLPTGAIFTEVGQMVATGASGEYDLVNMNLD